MTGQQAKYKQKTARHFVALLAFFAVIFSSVSIAPLTAASGERTLDLYYTQTNESKRITFRRNGRYDQAGLRELNTFLRDWRRGESIEMDPALFDLIWQVYQDVGATKPIYIVSAYRSPKTNEMLRSRSRAVAKDSRHVVGMALDFYIPGVSPAKLREAAFLRQVGGVGYYPTSGNPFVHLDTGDVRAWPRMTRAQLNRLFPDGRTLHLPTDGVPISQEGRRYATAQWARCKSVPCVGSEANTAPNTNSGGAGGNSGRSLWDMIFGTNNDAPAPTLVADAGPAQRTVTSVPVAPPIPAARASFLDFRDLEIPPVPASMPPALVVATRTHTDNSPVLSTSLGIAPRATTIDSISVASISANPFPTNSLLQSTNEIQRSTIIGYAPVSQPEPNAQRALQMLIERRDAADALIAANPTTPGTTLGNSSGPDLLDADLRGSILTASLSPDISVDLNRIVGLFEATWDAVLTAIPANSAPLSGVPVASSPPRRIEFLPLTMRLVELIAPDLESVPRSLVAPTIMAGDHFAVLFEPDRGDFSPATQLGPLSGQVAFGFGQSGNLSSNRFTLQDPWLVSSL